METTNIKINDPVFNPSTTTVDVGVELPVILLGGHGPHPPVPPHPIPGPPGPPGPQGVQGIQGPIGMHGHMGPVGPTGAQGAVGAGFRIDGSVNFPQDLRDQPLGSIWLVGGVELFIQVGYEKGDEGTWNKSWKDIGPLNTQGTQGIQGVQGIQGEPGPTGETGIQGIAGEVGPQGAVGPQGIQGIHGIQGEIGPIGATGVQGIVGEVGPQGAQGIAGELGLQGAVGPQGIQGIMGPTGPEGPQGPTGEKGEPFVIKFKFKSRAEMEAHFNDPNIKLYDIAIIDSGVSGSSDNGKLYYKGLIEWEYITDISEYEIPGPTGPQGAQGPKGEPGPKGDAGETGAQGPASSLVFNSLDLAQAYVTAHKNDSPAVVWPGQLYSIIESDGQTISLYGVSSDYQLRLAVSSESSYDRRFPTPQDRQKGYMIINNTLDRTPIVLFQILIPQEDFDRIPDEVFDEYHIDKSTARQHIVVTADVRVEYFYDGDPNAEDAIPEYIRVIWDKDKFAALTDYAVVYLL